MNSTRFTTTAAKIHRAPALLRWLPPATAVSTAFAALAGGEFLGPARYAAMAALVLQVIVELYERRNRFLTSPLFLLSFVVAIFFSFVQGLWGRFITDFRWTLWGNRSQLPPAQDFTLYVDSIAEQIVLAFAMICLVIYFISSQNGNNSQIIDAPEENKKLNYVPFLFISLAISITILNCTLYELNFYKGASFLFFLQIQFATPPLISACLFYLVRSAAGSRPAFKMAVGLTAVAAIAGLAYVHEGKLVILISGALMLYAIRLGNPFPARILLTAATAAVLGLILLQTTQAIRVPATSIVAPNPVDGWDTRARMLSVFAWKLVWRQTETGACFRNVVRAHLDQPLTPSRQLFWLKGLVPRVIWPEKPSLSLGRAYASRYCGKPAATVGVHSASITLLGQPVIQGGWPGLLLHAGLLLLALAAIERLNADPRTLPTMMTAAMLPWLIDFDQDFALYVANAVKFGLVMAAVTVPVAMIEKRLLPGPE